MRLQVFAKVVLFRDDGKLLLLKRSETDSRRPGEWDLPGGGIEPGEELNSGAAREVMEEANIVVDPSELRLIYASTESYADRDSNTRLLFAGHSATDLVTVSFEHSEYKWVDIDTALREFPHPMYTKAIRYGRDNDLFSPAVLTVG